VALQKKKVVTYLLSAVLIGSALLLYPVSTCAVEPNMPFKFYSSSSSDPNESRFLDADSSEMFKRAMLAVLIVIVFGAATIFLSKKLLPRISKLSGKEIRVIETIHLGPRKAVHLLEIGKQRIVIGSTNERITKLADVIVPFSELGISAKELD